MRVPRLHAIALGVWLCSLPLLPGPSVELAERTRRLSEDGRRPLVVHNIGDGPEVEDSLFAFEITGHYRYDSDPSGNGTGR